MTQSADDVPAGIDPFDGVEHRRSALTVSEAVEALSAAIKGAGAKLFATIDQAAEAQAVGLRLRPTCLLVFGNPVAGTPIMDAAPVAALDLPLKLLVWEGAGGQTWITYLSGDWLSSRYGVPDDLAAALSAPATLAGHATGR